MMTSLHESVLANATDVVAEGCYWPYFGILACTRNVVFGVVSGSLLVLCLYRLRGYYATDRVMAAMHVYYILSAVQFVCLGLHSFIYFNNKWIQLLEHFAQCLRLGQVLMLIHCYWTEAYLYLPHQDRARTNVKRLTIVLFILILIEFVALINFVSPIKEDCQNWRNLLLPSLDLASVLILVPAISMNIRSLEAFEVDSNSKWVWLRPPVTVMTAYLVSSLTWFIYSVVLYTMVRQHMCASVFMSNQIVYTVAYSCYLGLLFVVPFFAVFSAFYPVVYQIHGSINPSIQNHQYGTF